jgi:hypothetical protein
MARKMFVVTGVKEIDRAFKELPTAVAKKVVKQAIRKALKPLLSEARSTAPIDTGAMKKSIKIKVGGQRSGRRKSRILLRILPQTIVQKDGSGQPISTKFYAKFIEEGWTSRGGNWIAGVHWMESAFKSKKAQVRADAMKEIRKGIFVQLNNLGKRRGSSKP